MRKFFLLAFLCALFVLVGSGAKKTPEAAMEAVLHTLALSPAGPMTSEEVLLPAADDKAWTPYIEMQAENGYDMRPYCGKTVQKLSCPVTAHWQGEPVYVHLYVADGRVIGGDIMTVALDGYMQAIPPGADA